MPRSACAKRRRAAGALVAKPVGMPAEVRCYDYVNQPFEVVRKAVVTDPQELLRQGAGGKLRVRLGGLDVGTEIDVEVAGVTEIREAPERPTTHLTLTWRHRRNPSWFPAMTATLAIYALSPTETQIDLSGTYTPPHGTVGEVVDIAAMGRLAKESVGTFVREIAAHLRKTLARRLASA